MTSPLPYDLCLKLKEAGWPQPVGAEIRKREECGASIVFGEEIGGFSTAWAYSPGLEELIEACPKEMRVDEEKFYFNLRSAPGGSFVAGYMTMLGIFHRDETQGSSPKEAVANLWLKLQEKNT